MLNAYSLTRISKHSKQLHCKVWRSAFPCHSLCGGDLFSNWPASATKNQTRCTCVSKQQRLPPVTRLCWDSGFTDVVACSRIATYSSLAGQTILGLGLPKPPPAQNRLGRETRWMWNARIRGEYTENHCNNQPWRAERLRLSVLQQSRSYSALLPKEPGQRSHR